MTAYIYEFRGNRYLIRELVEISGVDGETIRKRLMRGWTLEQALTTPTIKQRRAGVVSNFAALAGTGGGSVAQDRAEIEFSGNAESPAP